MTEVMADAKPTTKPDVDLTDGTFYADGGARGAYGWMRANEPVFRDRNGLAAASTYQAVIDGPEEDRDPDGRPVQLDTTAPDGYETAEVSAAKTLVGDILGTDFGGYGNGDLDTLVAADRIINRLVAAGWRPTIADPYFASEELLREIDRQRE